MIHVNRSRTPQGFRNRVSRPGRAFLKGCPHPTRDQWKNHAYWVKVGSDLYESYNQICAYSAHWIPPDTGFRTCEHFRPKDRHPRLAYVWSNYRLVCGTLNGRKGTNEVLDPFRIADDWFVIDFPSLLVRARADLDPSISVRIQETIDLLGLNDEGTCLGARASWLSEYCSLVGHAGGMSALAFLHRRAPFLARELVRQNLTQTIVNIML